MGCYLSSRICRSQTWCIDRVWQLWRGPKVPSPRRYEVIIYPKTAKQTSNAEYLNSTDTTPLDAWHDIALGVLLSLAFLFLLLFPSCRQSHSRYCFCSHCCLCFCQFLWKQASICCNRCCHSLQFYDQGSFSVARSSSNSILSINGRNCAAEHDDVHVGAIKLSWSFGVGESGPMEWLLRLGEMWLGKSPSSTRRCRELTIRIVPERIKKWKESKYQKDTQISSTEDLARKSLRNGILLSLDSQPCSFRFSHVGV